MKKTKEELAAYMRQYYADNKAYIKWYKKKYHAKNREAINARRRAKYANDPEFRKYEIERHRKRKHKEEDHD